MVSFMENLKSIENKRGSPHKITAEEIMHVPKEYWIHCAHPSLVSEVFNKLPHYLRTDLDILKRLPCTEHYQRNNSRNGWDDFDGPTPIRLECFKCAALEMKKNDSKNQAFKSARQ